MSSNCFKVSILKADDELSLLGSEAMMYECLVVARIGSTLLFWWTDMILSCFTRN